MRILIVTHVFGKNDGQGRVNYEIAKAALAAGHEVTMLASKVADELAAHALARVVLIPESRVPTRLVQYQFFAARSGAWIRAHRAEFDLVHVNGYITWARADINSVHFVHSGWRDCGFYPFRLTASMRDAYQVVYTAVNAWCERWAFRHSDIVVPVSQKVGYELAALGVAKDQVEVIHNGVDIDEFSPGEGKRERFGLPAEPFMLLFAGDLRVSRKNLDTLLQALSKTPPEIHLTVAGAVRNTVYPMLAKSLGVADRVHFVDFIKDMPDLMRSVDAFVFPSRYEAMSLALLEAMASGLPVVTVKTAGGAEVIPKSCGIVLDDPDDAPALAAAIARLASQRERARAMGIAARERARSLSWQHMVSRYLDMYEVLAARRTGHERRSASTAISAES